MRKKIIYIIFMILAFVIKSKAQAQSDKKLVDNNTYKEFIQLNRYLFDVSKNGQWIYYTYGNHYSHTVVLKSFKDDFEFKIQNGSGASFTSDSRMFICESDQNSITIINLTNRKTMKINDASNPKIFNSGLTPYLAYWFDSNIVVRNLYSSEEYIINDIPDSEVITNKEQNVMFIKSPKGLFRFDTQLKKLIQIWDKEVGDNVIFDERGNQALFISNGSIFVINNIKNSLKEIVSDSVLKTTFKTSLYPETPSFSQDGNRVFFKLKPQKLLTANADSVYDAKMELWNYKFMNNLNEYPKVTLSCISLNSNTSDCTTLGSGHVRYTNFNITGGKYVILKEAVAYDGEVYLNSKYRPKYYLVRLDNGTRELITPEIGAEPIGDIQLSHNEKFMFWWGGSKRDLYTYDIESRITRNVTKKIKLPADIIEPHSGSKSFRLDSYHVKWVGNDDMILIGDKFDIWRIDPLDKKLPFNLTGAMGRSKSIQFKFMDLDDHVDLLSAKAKVLVKVFDTNTKDAGFATLEVSSKINVTLGSLEPVSYRKLLPPLIRNINGQTQFFVCRESVNISPNLYVSSDLKTYKRITNINPEKEYNWLSSELITYQLVEGKIGQAILYKPENFDPQKKYPVIFNYYQQRSFQLNEFSQPELFAFNIDIPWYTSNGYLVVVPDISNNDPGFIMENTVAAVDSLVDFLKKYSWFDYTKMGLQGQSFGGYETNLLITNSKNNFAAALSMDGISDARGGVFGKMGDEQSVFWFYERGQFNFNVDIWGRPDIYEKNSPVSHAHRVTTPLLLLHSRNDKTVPFSQSEAMFFALRRLSKPVWLISYKSEQGNHGMPGDIQDRLDFTVRQQQFFNHFLKGSTIPKWMNENTLSLEQ